MFLFLTVIFLLVSFSYCLGIDLFWQDLDRIVAENGGIKEKEPFFLSVASYEEV